LLFTDSFGVTDAGMMHGGALGKEGLFELLRGNVGSTVEETIDVVLRNANEKGAFDDMTMFGVGLNQVKSS
jgi:serine/threonine protein phosphatase PrpC